MFETYKKLYIEELKRSKFFEYESDYFQKQLSKYKELVDCDKEQIDCYKDQIQIYEQDYKKTKRLSNIGFWLGASSLVIVIIISILKAVIK